MSDTKYHVQVTTKDGQSLLWHKHGQPHALPEELADIWVQNFKPDVFLINAKGEMVGRGRSEAEGAFEIVKVEKVAIK